MTSNYERVQEEIKEFLARLPSIYEEVTEEFPSQPNANPTPKPLAVPMTPTEGSPKEKHPRRLIRGTSDAIPPQVDNLDEARYWIGILWKYGVQDAERMNRIEERLNELEYRQWGS